MPLSDGHMYAITNDGGDKRNFLQKDGFNVPCCNVPPYIEMNTVTQKPEYKRLLCSTECPHAALMANEKEEWFYVITCSGSVRQLRLATEKELEDAKKTKEEPKPRGLIIT